MRFELRKLIKFIWNKEELPKNWQESFIVPVYKKGEKINCSNYRGILLFSTTFTILSNILQSRLTLYAGEFIGIISMDFDATDQLLIIHSVFVKYLRRNGNRVKQCITSF